MTNPIDNPAAHDVFKVDKIVSPFCRITECNGREFTWQEQQAPGFTGAFVVFRGAKLVTITYGIEIIDRPGFTKADTFLAYIDAASKARPPRGMKLFDLRLAVLRIPQVAVARLPWQELLEPGKWGYKVKLQEYARLRLAGGPVKAARDGGEVLIAGLENQLKGSMANREAAEAQARAAVGEQGRRNKHVTGS